MKKAQTERTHLFPIAGPASTRATAWPPPDGDAAVWRAIERAALEGGSTLDEVLERCGVVLAHERDAWVARLRDSGEALQLIPYGGRYHYDWIAVDLRQSPGPELVGATRLTDPQLSGLALVRSRLPVRHSPHVHVLTAEDLESKPLSAFAFVQLVRSLLRFLPRARLLLADAAAGALLRDVLARHTARLGPAVNEAAQPWANGAQPKVKARTSVARALAWVESSEPETDLDTLPDAVPEVRAALASLANRTPVGSGDVGVARFLTPGVLSFSPAELPEESSEVRIRSVLLSDRERDEKRGTALFACLHLLGDLVNTTQSLHEYRLRHPDDFVTLVVPDRAYARIMELSADVDELLYVTGRSHDAIVFESSTEHALSLPPFEEARGFRHVFDIQKTPRKDAGGRRLHLCETYAEALGYTLSSTKPRLDRGRAERFDSGCSPDEPYVVIARHTVSGAQFDPRHPSTKRWSEWRWKELAQRIRSELDLLPVSIGVPNEAPLQSPGVVNLHDLDIRAVAHVLNRARALICVDNGIYHVGLALDVPTVHLCPAWLFPEWTRSPAEGPYRDLHRRMSRILTTEVFAALEEVLTASQGRGPALRRSRSQ